MESTFGGGYVVPVPVPTANRAPHWSELQQWASGHTRLHLDLGTGDGTFTLRLARAHQEIGVIGVDTCLDHLHGSSRRLPANVRFVQANAVTMPLDALPRLHAVTINFPYGSLLREVITSEQRLLARLARSLTIGGRIEVRINERALADTVQNLMLGDANRAIIGALRATGRLRADSVPIDQRGLRTYPSSWSKRLGYGRPTLAVLVMGQRYE